MLILKLGERGVLACCGADHESLDSFFVIDSFVDRLVDAVGAERVRAPSFLRVVPRTPRSTSGAR